MFRKSILWMLVLLLCACAIAEEPDPNARFRGIPTLELESGFYRLNRHLTTVLLMGIDKTTQELSNAGYRSGGQADFLALLIVNDAKKSISLIQINRDTMVELTVLNVLGEVSGKRTGQICLSHAFGNGGVQSCEMTIDAVSKLLNQTPINYYIAMNMDGIASLNDILGGIEVTLEDDFTAFDPEMSPGKTLRLNGQQAEYYVRGRYHIGDQTNLSRLHRQKDYMHSALAALKMRLNENPDFFKVLNEHLEPYLSSSLSRGALYNIGEKATRYAFDPIYEISGSAQVGESGFMEFYPDENALKCMLADLLYEKVN